VRETVAGAEAVLSALGGAGLAQPGTILSTGMRQIVSAMKEHGVRRVLAVAGSGVLDAPGGGLRAEAPDFPPIYGPITEEHRGTWNALRESGLDWTLVCCPDLLDGKLMTRFRVVPDMLPEGGRSISVEDTADFMLRQVADTSFVRRRVGLAY
jgi:putative NADH-flavin reductase